MPIARAVPHVIAGPAAPQLAGPLPSLLASTCPDPLRSAEVRATRAAFEERACPSGGTNQHDYER